MSHLEPDVTQGHLLVVDDDPVNVKLLERVLAQAGYTRVSSIQNPFDVVDVLQRDDIDLILLDLNMPGLDGYGVMEQVGRLALDVPPAILMLTAQSAMEHRLRALESGAHDYVNKPFDRIELLARVRNLLDWRVARKELHQQNQELDARVRARTRELYETRLEIVRRLGRAAEYRDNETGMHIVRMSRYSVMLAEQAGMSPEACDLLLNAAPMHDIGKIGIPDRILLKPGKLDADEWEVMKTHTLIGAEILSGSESELLLMAKEIALTHHEKWDGSGYPHGLAGESIPLVGRIVAVADVFDALTSERPYKHAWTVEQALQFLHEHAGTHFDADLVALFERNMDEVDRVRQRYPDEIENG